LIKPDYANWKPKDRENQYLMRLAHRFEDDENDTEVYYLK
jgi:hypothetical protein